MKNNKIMKKSEIGKIGEEKACEFLIKNGYEVLERNYWQKFGEIDIIAKAGDQTLAFIEVKTLLIKCGSAFSPEDNLTTQKYRNVKRMGEFFAAGHDYLINEKRGWRIDLIAVEFFDEKEEFILRHYENI
jgi:putative endonuclease